jgi:hypothetical protein
MAGTGFRLNSASMAALLKSDEVRAMLTEKAQPVLAAAQSTAPVRSGEYRGGLEIQQATTDRAVVRVTATAPYSLAVEAKTGILSRALDAAG